MNDSGVEFSKDRSIKDLENLLKCGICYEYFCTTLMTPCSHNYCSYCIRQSLLYRNHCPSCFEETSESQLRPNRLVDNILTVYSKIKDKSKNSVDIPVIKNVLSHTTVNDEFSGIYNTNSDKNKLFPCSSEATNSNVEFAGPKWVSKEEPSSSKKELRIPNMFSPKKSISKANEKKVSCPVCLVEIPERNINIHLDACLKRSLEKSIPLPEKRKPLPKLVYHLLSDKELRKKLSEIGLSTLGDHKTLVNRHKRYTLLYNSECDSVKPRQVADIIKQLKKEEEDEKKTLTQTVKKLNVDRKNDPQVNEEAQRNYLLEHKASFQKLVEAARKSRNVKKDVDHLVSTKNEPTLISLDDHSSDTSDSSDFKIKRPALKRKLITSDSEVDSDCDNVEGEKHSCQVVVEANVHVQKTPLKVNSHCNTSNKENESALTSKMNIENNSSPEVCNNLIDGMSSSENDETPNRIFEEVEKKNRRLKEQEKLNSPNVKVSRSTPSLNTSPILSSKVKNSRTPRQTIVCPEQMKPDVPTDILLNEMYPTSSLGVKSTAGQCFDEDIVDSDSSSNHSTSLMMYTGPDCDILFDQSTPRTSPVKTPVKTSAIESSKSKLQINNFDLGIIDILQNSEDFESLPVRRQSKRLKDTLKVSPGTTPKVVRKRMKKSEGDL